MVLMDYIIEHKRPTKRVPKKLEPLVNEIKSAIKQGKIVAATDGGYDPTTDLGTIGVCVNGKSFGYVVDQQCSSSTQPELVGHMTLRVALKCAGGLQDDTQWSSVTDSLAANARYERRHEGDPVHATLHCVPCPPPKWSKGHAGDEDINKADAAATTARTTYQACPRCSENKRCTSCATISLRTLYTLAGICSFCVHKPTGVVQMDTLPAFLRETSKQSSNAAVRKATKGWAPASALDPKILRRLSRLPGALDLLQAMVRRAIHPRGTTTPCPGQGCRQTLTLDHILIVENRKHLAFCGGSKAECSSSSLFPRTIVTKARRKRLTASATNILDAFAYGDRDIIKLVAIRIAALTDDPLAKRWSQWLLSYLQPLQL